MLICGFRSLKNNFGGEDYMEFLAFLVLLVRILVYIFGVSSRTKVSSASSFLKCEPICPSEPSQVELLNGIPTFPRKDVCAGGF